MKGNTLESLDIAEQQGRRKAVWDRMKAWIEGRIAVTIPVPSWPSTQASTASEVRMLQDHGKAGLANTLNSFSRAVDAVVEAVAPALYGFDPAAPGSDLTVIQVAHKRYVCARRARKLRKRGVPCWYAGRTCTGKARFTYWRMQ